MWALPHSWTYTYDALNRLKQVDSGQASARLRKQVRSGDNSAAVAVLLGIGSTAIGLFDLASGASIGFVVSILFGLLSIGYAIYWNGWGRLQCLHGPQKLQQEIDEVEAEIARHKSFVDGEQ